MFQLRQITRLGAAAGRGCRHAAGLPPLTAMQMARAAGVLRSGEARSHSTAEVSGDESDGGELFLRHLLRYPRVGERAPHFKAQAVVDRQFKELDSDAFRGKWLVLFFYPLDFTFVCPTEITAFSDRAADFRSMNCEVVACSTDSHFSHLAWVNTPRKEGGLGDMDIAMLADYKKEIATAYGVLNKDVGAAYRGLFLIDTSGVVRHMQCNDFPVGRSVDEVLRLLAAFQFVEKHGEVCPANWNPTDKKATIKPDPKGSKEFFNKHG